MRAVIAIIALFGSTAFAQISKVAANPQKGFDWPYYLYVPPAIRHPTILLVEPNNTGSGNDDPAVHDAAASSLINAHKVRADDLGAPFLVPTFPRPRTNWTLYTHALDRDTLRASVPGLTRIDLQLIAMIDDARARLAALRIQAGPKVWMVGYSASGSFTNRFAVLHPERVQAASAGSGGEYAIAPVSNWKGKKLRYPVGVADFEQLTGRPFDAAAFRNVPLQIYIGDLQVDDAVDHTDGYDPEDAALIKEVFGGPTFLRYPSSEAAYLSIGSACQFVIFPGVGHVWPEWSFIRDFLERNRAEPFPAPQPKPLLYKLFFPHVANFGQWETEIALTNTSEVSIQGQLEAFTADGASPGLPIPVTVPPLGRRQIDVGNSFPSSREIAYVAFISNSGFLAGYTRFSQPGNRVSMAAATGSRLGWFTKMENDGWTGIAFVNTETGNATVDLTACDADGGRIGSRKLELVPGQKYVGMVDQLFPVDLRAATYFKFESDKNVVAFTVSGSADGRQLDGLHCLGDYVK
jgi:pimeloyl-ACP methyl ester carboxylesterase